MNELERVKLQEIKEDAIEVLIDFLIHLNKKGLINNHDFDYEKESKKYIKKLLITPKDKYKKLLEKMNVFLKLAKRYIIN